MLLLSDLLFLTWPAPYLVLWVLDYDLGLPLTTLCRLSRIDLGLQLDYAYFCSLLMTLAWLLTTSLLTLCDDPGLPSSHAHDLNWYLQLRLTVRPRSLCTKYPRSCSHCLPAATIFGPPPVCLHCC